MDKLTITGLSRSLDGTYEFDISDMLGIGRPSMLNGHEAHVFKRDFGILAAGPQLLDGLMDGDWDAYLGLTSVVLGRHGKRATVDQLRDLPLSAIALDFEPVKITAADLEDGDDADPPPEVASTPTADGGTSGKPTSALSENDRSPIGLPGSPRYATSAPLTSVS